MKLFKYTHKCNICKDYYGSDFKEDKIVRLEHGVWTRTSDKICPYCLADLARKGKMFRDRRRKI